MNTRVITAFLVLGMAAALFFTYVRPSHRLLAPVIGSPAAAQTSSLAIVQVKSLPNSGQNDGDLWHHYEITVPVTGPPLDMHIAFLVDGKTEDTVFRNPRWPQPVPFKYRLDHDDDSRVKDILKAQGLPVKQDLVTYKFATEAGNEISFSQTIQFKGGLGGPQEWLAHNDTLGAAVGEKIILEDTITAGRDFKEDFGKIRDSDLRMLPEYAPKTPPGMVHHLVVYMLFKPHAGAAGTVHQTNTQKL